MKTRWITNFALAIAGGLAVAAASGITAPAKANLIFTGTGTAADGAALSATVDFSLTGSTFKIVLTNNNVALSQGSVLTNLGFSFAPAPALALPSASGSAALTAGSSLVATFGGAIDSTPIGAEWAYLSGGGASSGFGVGTGDGNLCGTVACGVPLDGSAFGLVGTGTDLTLDGMKSGGVGNNGRTYIQDSITILITLALNSTFALSDITSVDFQYGTGPGEGDIQVPGCTSGSNCTTGGGGGPGPPPIPEPGSLLLLGTGLLSGAIIRRRKAKA